MSTPRDERPRTARFYTSISRIPVLIGKIGESRLIGGPYTPTQIVIGVLVLVIGYNTMPVWGPLVGSFALVRIFALLVAAGFALWASGQLPSSRRKVHNVVIDATGATFAPGAGKLNGRPVRLPKPHRISGTVLIEPDPFDVDELDALAATTPVETAPADLVAAAPVVVDEPTPVPAADIIPPVSKTPAPAFASGLDRLLQQARVKED